jgi:hypothetical protein
MSLPLKCGRLYEMQTMFLEKRKKRYKIKRNFKMKAQLNTLSLVCPL